MKTKKPINHHDDDDHQLIPSILSSKDYQLFLNPSFNPQTFSNSLIFNHHSTFDRFLSNSSIPSTSDPSTNLPYLNLSLQKLNLSIDEINKQIRTTISSNHLNLLLKSHSIIKLDHHLNQIKSSLHQIDSNLIKLHSKLSNPYRDLSSNLHKLDRFQSLLIKSKSILRFIQLKKRLDSQLVNLNSTSSSNLIESTLTLSEIENLINPIDDQSTSINAFKAVQLHSNPIQLTRQKLQSDMNQILNNGLIQLDHTLLSTAFQIAFNLSILPQSITLIIRNLIQTVQSSIKSTFDLNSLAIQSNLQDQSNTSSFVYKSRSRTEPTSSNHSQWTHLLWSRLESLIDDLSSSCIKLYTLEKVLDWKKTSSTLQAKSFLDEVIEKSSELDFTPPRTIFWTTLRIALENESREASRGKVCSYPRLLRLFHEFFSRISLHTHTTYNQCTQSPETILTLRAISPFESVYLERFRNRILEGLNSSKIERLNPILINELDAARFDPLLIRSVAKNIKEILNDYLNRISERIDREQYSNPGSGSNLLNGSQHSNIETSNMISDLIESLTNLITEYSTTNQEISNLLTTTVIQSKEIQTKILNPIIKSIRRDFSLLIGKMHQPTKNDHYLKGLIERINLIKTEIINQMKTEFIIKEMSSYLINCFLFHLSLKDELNEMCKLNLTSEISELEFNLTQLIEEDEIRFNRDLFELVIKLKSLRDFKQIIFTLNIQELEKEILLNQEVQEEVEEKKQKEFKKMVIIHHLLSRNSIQIHRFLGWNELEYWKWLEEHFDSINDWKLLVKKVLDEKIFCKLFKGDHENEENVKNHELDWIQKVLES